MSHNLLKTNESIMDKESNNEKEESPSTSYSSSKNNVETKKSSGERVKCDICQGTFGRNASLKQHIREVHENLHPFSCQTCEEKFKRKDRLKAHIDRCHLDHPDMKNNKPIKKIEEKLKVHDFDLRVPFIYFARKETLNT